jgi:ornithine--oxo-acid transaminase
VVLDRPHDENFIRRSEGFHAGALLFFTVMPDTIRTDAPWEEKVLRETGQMGQAATKEAPVQGAREVSRTYAAHVNPKWVGVLDVLGMNVRYTRCEGAELQSEDGRTILDALSGYCVYNMGHNHPAILADLADELKRMGPSMLQSHVPELAATLGRELTRRAGGQLTKVYFTSSGSEGVETVIKFARARTGRAGVLYAHGAFHGLTTGALSLMGNPWWREGFGALLPGTDAIPFGDLEALERRLASREIGVLLLEPVQAEAGIVVPPAGYLQEAQRLCRRHGTLFALDEVQTGMHRTGPFLAAHRDGLEPDMVVLAKALSGGLVPCGAVLMSDAVHGSVYSSLSRAFVHASTFGECSLAMRAGLATLRVMDEERLGERAESLGERLRAQLAARLRRFDMVETIRGAGMLNGVVFRPPSRFWTRAFFDAFSKVHAGMFGQMLVSELFRKEQILTQMCGNNFMVVKVAPPLTVSEEQIDRIAGALERVLERVHAGPGFWTASLGMVRRAAGI